MANWCTQLEIEDLLSSNGVSVSTNDSQGNSVSDPEIVAFAIERGQSKLAQYLTLKYDVSTITSANVWVKWAAATFAAVEIMRRKGGVVPPGLQEMYEEYIVSLKDVKDGPGLIPDLPQRTTPGMAVSNVMIDNAYSRAKVRVVGTISFPIGVTKLAQFRDRNDLG
ncbi:MAG: hypothetical protein V4719_29025 [Planctomycetota bacterium]